ncbi:alpha/beta hydrolase [Sphingobium lactosutens]|uniref:alpha/beta hydrolase n=1 Tax=Sphingobium lactosutens TaxID=522773 RepID=UPI0015BDF588|nr:alpha/beta hydrolase [Sphingobium lactosutens]NWK97409.1 alpha/beta hydrolase [Sphingobium lactosutens]
MIKSGKGGTFSGAEERMVFGYTVRYLRTPLGAMDAPPDMAERRQTMDARGDEPIGDVTIERCPDGPGRSEWLWPKRRSQSGAILFLHGSGMSKGSPASHRPLIARIVAAVGIPAFVVDYRLAPEHPFPSALEDAVEAYRSLLLRVPAHAVAVMGDSAGGGLVLAMLLAAAAQGLAMPAAAVTLSAWTDLAVTGSAPDVDDPVVTQQKLRDAAATYLDGADPFSPMASPLYGDLSSLPPLLMQVGSREIMLADTTRFAERAVEQGRDVRVSVYPGMTHVFQLNALESPLASEAIVEIARFVETNISALVR